MEMVMNKEIGIESETSKVERIFLKKKNKYCRYCLKLQVLWMKFSGSRQSGIKKIS